MEANQAVSAGQPMGMLPLEDFGALQQRYQTLRLTHRAVTVLEDAKPALQMVDALLASLAKNPKIFLVVDTIRKNTVLVERMRASEAKTVLLDPNNDFIASAQQKLASWRKTMERIAAGEGIVADNSEEYIPAHIPLAIAITKLNSIGGYLSVIQLALAELAKWDSAGADQHTANIAKIRRCATFLSDCELASSIATLVH